MTIQVFLHQNALLRSTVLHCPSTIPANSPLFHSELNPEIMLSSLIATYQPSIHDRIHFFRDQRTISQLQRMEPLTAPNDIVIGFPCTASYPKGTKSFRRKNNSNTLLLHAFMCILVTTNTCTHMSQYPNKFKCSSVPLYATLARYGCKIEAQQPVYVISS